MAEPKVKKIEVHPTNLDIDLDGKYYGIRITLNHGNARLTTVEHKTKDGNWVALSCIQRIQITLDVKDPVPKVVIEQIIA